MQTTSPSDSADSESFSLPPAVKRLLVVLGVALLVQGWALKADFYMDDNLHILFNSEIKNGEIDNRGVFMGRMLPKWVWRQTYLAADFSSTAFHALNLVAHMALAGLLVSVLASVAKLAPSLRDASTSIGFWGALIFACHPLVSEPVNYAAQLTILMATFFSVLTLWCYFRWQASGKPALLAATGLCVLLAGFSKEPGFWHAAVNLFFVVLLSQDLDVRRYLQRQAVRLTLIGVLGIGAIAFASSWLPVLIKQLSDGERLFHYMLTQSRVLFSYFGQMLVPVGLSSDHHVAWTISGKDTEAMVKFLLVIAGTLGILYAYLVKRRWLAAALGLVVFHLLLRFFYTIDELMVEYRTYPSMPWVALLFAAGLWKATEGLKASRKQARLIVSTAVVVVFGALSIQRSFVWHDADRLSLNVLESYPTNMRALTGHYHQASQRQEFTKLLQSAEAPDQIVAEINAYHDRVGVRRYSERRRDKDYSSAQYYLIRAMIARGYVEQGLELSQTLFMKHLNQELEHSSEELRQSFLSRALCAYFAGDGDLVRETLRLANFREDFQRKIAEMLKIEIQIAKSNQQVPLVASVPEPN